MSLDDGNKNSLTLIGRKVTGKFGLVHSIFSSPLNK